MGGEYNETEHTPEESESELNEVELCEMHAATLGNAWQRLATLACCPACYILTLQRRRCLIAHPLG